MDIPDQELDTEALLIPVEPTIETITLKEFVERIEQKENSLFTDGYVFGDTGSVSDEFGVDTCVPGGDSTYHMGNTKAGGKAPTINITKNGFSFLSDASDRLVQFIFMEQVPAPAISNLGELSKYQAESPLNMVTDNLNDIAEVGNSAIHTVEKNGDIEIYVLNHFEDPELSNTLSPTTKLSRVDKNKLTTKTELSDYLSDELIFLKPETNPWKL